MQSITLGGRALRWLNPQQINGAVTWGMPWPKGALNPGDTPSLKQGSREVPVQTWPTASWPDGSVKWSAHAAVFTERNEEAWLVVKSTDTGWSVDTGALAWQVFRSGDTWAGPGNLRGFCLHEARVLNQDGSETRRVEEHRAVVKKAVIESEGPLRVVFRLEGVHRSPQGREWLPFVVRLTFWAGRTDVSIVHTFLYDGEPATDFIQGLGIRTDVALPGDPWDHHAAFVGDQGVVREAACGLAMRRDKIHPELYRAQHAGQPADVVGTGDEAYRKLVADLAQWDSWRLHQGSSDTWTLRKRTARVNAWIDAWHGRRARGVVYAGTAGVGGISLGQRNFWKLAPSALEASGLVGNQATLTAWLWSPDAPAMDLRHYDTVAHEPSSYEGFPEMGADPVGVAHTSELTLTRHLYVPDDQALVALANRLESPPLLVLSPEDYQAAGALGVWKVVDRSTPDRAAVEDQLDSLLNFYLAEVERRRWYGFWHYGDVMHTYDPVRHVWRYDVGGYAWQNTELVPNLWLWTSFLRTGREDVYRMAEAMTRHTSETDVYHLGRHQGLGSRHNVVHWGCGCKEARISMAALHRPFYYLTADARTGEILDEVRDVDFATSKLDPMRAYFPKDDHPAHIRSGPDWAAFASNWMTCWERHGDTAARDKLLRGLADLKAMPHRLVSGPTFGYDPADGSLTYLSDNNYSYHMVIAFGAPEVWFELADLLDDDEWRDMLAEFGECYTLTDAELQAKTKGGVKKTDWEWPMFAVRMIAYAGQRYRRPDLIQKAWTILREHNDFLKAGAPFQATTVTSPDVPVPVVEVPWLSTNWASQWSLNAIELLALDHA